MKVRVLFFGMLRDLTGRGSDLLTLPEHATLGDVVIHYEDMAPRLVFHCDGNRHFLAAAWIGEVNIGHELFASSAELEYARTTKQEQTIVLATR